MRKNAIFIFTLIAALALAGCASTTTPPSSESDPNLPVITVVNNTGYTCHYLFLSPSSTENWEEDLLGKSVLRNGQSLRVRLAYPLSRENRYDFMMIDEDEDSYTKWGVPLTENAIVVFTMRDIDN